MYVENEEILENYARPKMFYMQHKNVVHFLSFIVARVLYIAHVREKEFAIWMHAAVSG